MITLKPKKIKKEEKSSSSSKIEFLELYIRKQSSMALLKITSQFILVLKRA